VERRLQAGPERRLAALESALQQARCAARPAAASVLAEAADELRRTRAELQDLARGLHPPAVTDQGLRVAVDGLAGRAPVPVELQVTDRPLSARVEATVYFLCSEALANVAKHAHATRAGVEITVAGALVRVVVWDDGRGGADATRGSGLQGLADRVEASGGALRVESPAGGGTRLVAELPWTEP
jgi:signal transduction histidine kinase